MKYRSKRFLALMLSVVMALAPTTGVLAEQISPDVLVGTTEKTTEADKTTERIGEKVTEKAEEKVTEKAAEKTEEKVTEKAAEKAEEKVTEKAAEKTEEKITERVTETSTEKKEETEIQETAGTEVGGTERNETNPETTGTEPMTDTKQEETGSEGEMTETSGNATEETGADTEGESTEPTEANVETENFETDHVEETETVTETESEAIKEVQEKVPDKESAHEKDVDGKTVAVDSQTRLPDGIYVPEAFTAEAVEETEPITIQCVKVTVTEGKAYATIVVGGEQYTYTKANGNKYTGVNENGTSTFVIPVDLNVENAMILFDKEKEAEIGYKILVKLAEPQEETEAETELVTERLVVLEEVQLISEDKATSEVKDGSYTTTATPNTGMFKIVNVELTVKDGTVDAIVTLSGTGFRYLYLGTAEAAGTDTGNWISVKDTVDYISEGETKTGNRFELKNVILDTPMAVASCSASKGEWKDRTITISSADIKESGSFEGNEEGGKEEIKDGSYTTTATPNTGMFKIVNVELTVKDGTVDAIVTLSGTGFRYLYLGTAEAAGTDTDNWISVKDTVDYISEGETKTGNRFELKNVILDTPMAVASCSASKGEWKDRTITINSADMKETGSSEEENPGKDDEQQDPNAGSAEPDSSTIPVDNTTTLPDGEYKPDTFTFSGGSGRTTISCSKITIKDGRAYATVAFSSSSYAYAKAGGYKFYPTIVDGKATFEIPIALNKDNTLIGQTTAMSVPTEITYSVHATLTANSEQPEETEKETETETQSTPDNPSGFQGNGDYGIKVDNTNKMFRVVDCVLTYKDGKMVARVTMSGVGSDLLYMGTVEDAPANSDKWIKAVDKVINSEGKEAFRFDIPVSALDTEIVFASHAAESGKWSKRWLTFYSDSMVLIDSKGENTTTESESGTQKETEKETDKTADKESKYESDTSGSTSAVDSSTGLADGVYTPDKFSWSGGSGRTSISCTKVTVSGGQAYATIVFSSSNYGYVKANGRKYYPTYGSGTSIFTIPVNLNANNRIIGMTTAMSAAHEITYTIYVYIAGADDTSSSKEKELGKDALSEDIPEIIGLEYTDQAEIEYAEYFRIYYYDQGIAMIEVDMASDTDKPSSLGNY